MTDVTDVTDVNDVIPLLTKVSVPNKIWLGWLINGTVILSDSSEFILIVKCTSDYNPSDDPSDDPVVAECLNNASWNKVFSSRDGYTIWEVTIPLPTDNAVRFLLNALLEVNSSHDVLRIDMTG